MKNRLGFLFLGLGLVSILIGFARGEAMTVFMKSVNICLECIGIG